METQVVNDNIDLRRLVTLDTDQNLTAQYKFENRVVLQKELQSESVIGVDLQKIASQGVKLDQVQEITGSWLVGGNITFEGNVDGEGGVDGFNLDEFVVRKQKKMAERKFFENNYQVSQGIVQILCRGRVGK